MGVLVSGVRADHWALSFPSAVFPARFRHEVSSDLCCSDDSAVPVQGGGQQQALQVLTLGQAAGASRDIAYVASMLPAVLRGLEGKPKEEQ